MYCNAAAEYCSDVLLLINEWYISTCESINAIPPVLFAILQSIIQLSIIPDDWLNSILPATSLIAWLLDISEL